MKLIFRRKAAICASVAVMSTFLNPTVSVAQELDAATENNTEIEVVSTDPQEPIETSVQETQPDPETDGVEPIALTPESQVDPIRHADTQPAAAPNAGTGLVAAGSDTLVNPVVTLSEGKANWDWVRSFRQYVGRHQETRDKVELDPFNEFLLWPQKPNQQVDLTNLQKLQFEGSVHWTHHGGILDVTLANPTIDFAKKQLLVDGKSSGTLANPGVAVDEKQQVMLELTDLKAEVKEGYLLITSFRPKISSFANDLVGFYQDEFREPFVATLKIADSAGERPEPILWKLFPEKYDYLRPRNIVPDDSTLEDKPVTLDPALDKCVRYELDLGPNDPITTKTLQRLFTLPCNGVRTPEDQKVQSLEGLQHAHKLSRVNLANQRIADLSPLRELGNLIDLDVSNNKLTSINDIGHQPKLINFKANDNQLIDIDHLLYLPALETLELNNNKLFHLNGLPLDKENLRFLYVNNNEIESIEGLKEYLYLKDVDLSHNAIKDVSPLGKIRGLEKINVSHNFITNPETLVPLASFDNLRELRISHNKFESRDALAVFGSRLKDLPEGQPVPQNTNEAPAPKSAPTITQQPENKTVENGKAVLFTITVSGNPAPLIQWQRFDDGKWVDIEGATKNELAVTAGQGTAINGAQYRAVVRNAVKKIHSQSVILTVTEQPKPPNQTPPTSNPPTQNPPAADPGASSWKLGTGEIIGIVLAVLGGIGAIILGALQHFGITPQQISNLIRR